MFRPEIFNAHDELHYVYGRLLRARSARKQKRNAMIIDPAHDAKKMAMKVLASPTVDQHRSDSDNSTYYIAQHIF